jgi:hypothetical protein
MDAALIDRYRFFKAHGGGIVGRQAECALASARAEELLTEAVNLEVAQVEWTEETGWSWGDLGDVFTEDEMRAKFDSGEWTGPYVCAIHLPDNRYASSCGMIVLGSRGTDDPYARVMAAELVSDVEDELRQAIGDARDARMVCVS